VSLDGDAAGTEGSLTVEPFTSETAKATGADKPSTPAAATSNVEPVEPVKPVAPVEPANTDEDDGFISIDVEDDTDFSELIAAATEETAKEESPAATVEAPGKTASEEAVETPESVDLLAQILSEESEGLGSDSDQLATITAEIGSLVGGAGGEDDAGRLYEMGMVYLEMGLFDQACESFSVSACDEEFALRAHEMWGITLQRAQDPDESVRVLTDGLGHAVEGSREALSLRYHIAGAHEMAGRDEAALNIYQDIHDADPRFLDVKKKLKELHPVT